MPPLPKLVTTSLREYSSRLRYVPAAAAMRQLEHVESLALELLDDFTREPARAGVGYPLTWILFRLTGYVEGEAEEGRTVQIVGEALLGDLGSLAEHVCAAAKPEASEHRTGKGEWYTAGDLCRRWGVTQRTLQRLRGRGLLSRRVYGKSAGSEKRQAGKRLGTAVYSRSFVERFDPVMGRENGERERAGGRRVGMKAEARERVLSAARAMERGKGVSSASKEIAARLGLGKESVRRIIRAHEQRTGEALFSARATPRSIGQRRAISKQVQAGRRVGALSREAGVSRATVYRVTLEDRAAQLRAIEWPRVATAATFEHPEAEQVILGPRSVRIGLGEPWPSDLDALMRAASEQTASDARVEFDRAAAHAFLLYESRKEIELLRGGRAMRDSRSEGALRGLAWRIEKVTTMLAYAARLKTELIRSQLGLVRRSIAERFGGSSMTGRVRARVVEESVRAVARCVDDFDPFRGGRLAAGVSVALGKLLAHPVIERGGGEKSMEGVHDWAERAYEWQAKIEPGEIVRERLRHMSEEDDRARVLSLRFGYRLASSGVEDEVHPRSPVRVAEMLGLTAMRVRAIERRGIRELTGEG